MRKLSQDGGDSTSLTSGFEIEFIKSGILKSTRNSVKRKVQNLSHDNDDGVIEPLLQKDSEKTGIENQSAKSLSSKSKTDSIRDKEKDTEKLLADRKIDKPTISDVPGITGRLHADSALETSLPIAPIHNCMHSNVFSSNAGITECVVPKSEILVEIDGNKQSVYNSSPLIFTTAKIHNDENNRNMDIVNVKPIPILSTVKSNVAKSESVREPNGSIIYKNDNNVVKTYEKTYANVLPGTSTSHVGESLYIGKSLKDSSPENSVGNSASRGENETDINKNIETMDIDSSNLGLNLSIGNKYVSDVPTNDGKIIRTPSEVTKQTTAQNLTYTRLSNNRSNFGIKNTCVSSATSNNMSSTVPSFDKFTSTPTTISVTTVCKITNSKAIDTDLSLIQTNTPISSVKTIASNNLMSSITLDKTPTSSTIKSKNNLSTITKTPEVPTAKSYSSVSVINSKSPSNVATNNNNKNSTPATKSITSTSTVTSQIKAQSTTLSNIVATTSSSTPATTSSFKPTDTFSSMNAKTLMPSSASFRSKTAIDSAKIPSLVTKSASGSVKSIFTSNAISSTKTPKDVISKSTVSSRAPAISEVKAVSKPNATPPTSQTLSFPSTGQESSVNNKLVTKKTPATANIATVTRTSTSSSAAIPSGVETDASKLSFANKKTATQNNDRSNHGKGKA